MKLNKTILALAVCVAAIGCTKQGPTKLDNLSIESSYIAIDAAKGGSKSTNFDANDKWNIYDPTEDIAKLDVQIAEKQTEMDEYKAKNLDPLDNDPEYKKIVSALENTKKKLENYLESDEYIEDDVECELYVDLLEQELEELEEAIEPFDKKKAPYTKEYNNIKSKISSLEKQKANLQHNLPSWLTVSPMSGNAGKDIKLTFSADATDKTRDAEVLIKINNETQRVIVKQYVPSVAQAASCKDVIEGADSKTYLVTGMCTGIYNTTYGNWYLNDGTGEITIYGTLDKDGNTKNFLSWGLEVGDEVTVEGPKTTYGTTIELVDVTVKTIKKSLLKVESIKPRRVEKTGGLVKVRMSYKGDDLSFNNDLDWATVVGIEKDVDGYAVATVKVEANNAGKREGDITFSSTLTNGKESQTSAVPVTIRQKGSIIDATCAEVMSAPDGSSLYRVSGIVTKIANDTFGNLYITDATGDAYIYGVLVNGESKKFSTLGIKEGDIIEVVGPKTSYNGINEMKDVTVSWHKTVTKTAASEVSAMADDDKNDPKNYIRLTGKVTKPSAESGNKFDLETYGNFDLVDESGSIYVYGVSTGWKGETKKFSTLGVKEGDIITIVAYKTSYKGNAQVVGMYVSHEEDKPEPEPEPEPGNEFSTTVEYTPGTNSYNDGVATVNEVENVVVFKTGTSKAAGDLNFTIPAGKRGLRFYAVAWKGNTDAVISVTQDGAEVATIEPAANDGATGNSPYTLTVAPGDQYELDYGENLAEAVTINLSCEKRVIYFAVQAF